MRRQKKLTDYLAEAKGEWNADHNHSASAAALIVIAEELKKLNTHLRKGQTCIVEAV